MAFGHSGEDVPDTPTPDNDLYIYIISKDITYNELTTLFGSISYPKLLFHQFPVVSLSNALGIAVITVAIRHEIKPYRTHTHTHTSLYCILYHNALYILYETIPIILTYS